MPLTNEHAARLRSPGLFRRFRRKNEQFGPGIDAIFGMRTKRGETISEIQSIRFNKKLFTVSQARKWLRDHAFTPIIFEPAGEKKQRGLSMKDGFVTIQSNQYGFRAASGSTSGSDGVPRQRFTKDLIRLGNFIHPTTGQIIDVTHDRLQHWQSTFAAMKASGIDVTVPDGHDGENMGLVLDTWIAGDRLMGLFEMVGEDAIVKAERNKVSVFIVPEFVDGEGKKFKDAILHAALTPVPVISKQESFAPIAASRGSKTINKVPIYLSEDLKMDKLKQLLIDSLNLELAENADDETILAAVTAGLKTLAESKLSTDGDGDGDGDAAKLETLQGENDELKRQLAAAKPVPLSRDIQSLATRTVDNQFDRLIEQGKLTPAARDKLKPLLGNGAIMLSLEAAGKGKTQCLALDILEALSENDPVQLSQKTKEQVIALDRNTPDGKTEPDLDPDLATRGAAAYGAPPPVPAGAK